jgi:hypothetical protein
LRARSGAFKEVLMRAGLLVVLVWSAVTPLAHAQSSDEHAPAVAVGVGYAHALHGDLGYGAPVFSLSFRTPPFAYVAVEPEIGYWSHSSERRIGWGGPGSPAVQIRESRAFANAGVNVLVISSGARVRGYGGAGIGTYWERARYSQTVSENGAGIGSVDRTRTLGPRLGAQLVGGLDVVASKRVTVFGQFRFEARSLDDPGGAVLRTEAGVRFALP